MASINGKTFRGNIALEFDYKGKRTKVINEQIVYIMIDYNYIDNVLPIIYINFNVASKLFDDIVKYRKTAKFYLDISSDNILSQNSIPEKVLTGLFSYIPSVTTPNPTADMVDQTKTQDTSYQGLTIGLIPDEINDIVRTPFNGVYSGIDQQTLVAIALEGSKNCIIEPLEYNKKYPQVLIPPLNSKAKMLKFLFEMDPFYNTWYRYFNDFKYTYLLSQKGKSILKKKEQVIINIENAVSNNSYIEGIFKNGNTYSFYVNGMNAKYSVTDDSMGMMATEVVTVDSDMPAAFLKLKNKHQGTEKRIYARTKTGGVVKNVLDESTHSIEIMKENIDGNIFTPDKEYIIKNTGDSTKYDGTYLLVYKRSFYKSIGDSYVTYCTMGFKPVSSNQVKDATTTTSKSSKNSSSKDTKYTANITKRG